ncbi:MAG: peptide chain release factor 3 [Lachnospiraceae bacterium]|nr:peptide chain release factor 3 [Lachnospiraceae bacterium]
MHGEQQEVDTTAEIKSRRTFAIISHPDAGKTTLTEKFLLYGGAINLAGSVKGKATARHAVSDWMEIEKQRGISVTSSALQFHYNGACVNILDTPGHQDFSEDTYRTLMAADCAVMVIDASKGVEAQTKKLFRVCTMRHIPIFTFINKLDREALDTFALMEDIENHLGIETCPVNLPIGSGAQFKGIYERKSRQIVMYGDTQKGTKEGTEHRIDLSDTGRAREAVGEEALALLLEELELFDGAGADFDLTAVREGRLTPVFFGSALQNFGVGIFLRAFLEMAPEPAGRISEGQIIDPLTDDFSAFVFKIQANMNKAHRDRIAFFRICSGRYDAEDEVAHTQSGRTLRLSQPQTLIANERKILKEAYAGDIIGVFDPGLFSIGDTICTPGKSIRYEGIPTFAPEHFARVRQIDTMKRKQFVKGIEQIAQEGAIQIFHEPDSGLEEIIVGVVGVLQFEVLKFRLENEYNVEIAMDALPYEYIRWVDSDTDLKTLSGTSDMKKVTDLKGRPLLLFINEWSVNMTLERNPGLILTEFKNNA